MFDGNFGVAPEVGVCHDAGMSADDATEILHTIATVEQQERDLLFTTFTHDDAWRLGCLLVELGVERDLPITVDVQHGTQQVFHAARPGTTADNDSWVQRKVRVVWRFGASSYLVGLRARAQRHDVRLRSTTCRCRSTPRTAAPSRSACGTSGWSGS